MTEHIQRQAVKHTCCSRKAGGMGPCCTLFDTFIVGYLTLHSVITCQPMLKLEHAGKWLCCMHT